MAAPLPSGDPTIRKRMEDWVASGKFEQHVMEGFNEGMAEARGGVPESAFRFVGPTMGPAPIPAPMVSPCLDDEVADGEIVEE
jgi:hypothetical protein